MAPDVKGGAILDAYVFSRRRQTRSEGLKCVLWQYGGIAAFARAGTPINHHGHPQSPDGAARRHLRLERSQRLAKPAVGLQATVRARKAGAGSDAHRGRRQRLQVAVQSPRLDRRRLRPRPVPHMVRPGRGAGSMGRGGHILAQSLLRMPRARARVRVSSLAGPRTASAQHADLVPGRQGPPHPRSSAR